MSKKSKSAAPIASARVKFWTKFKLRRQGRQDAKRFPTLEDFTRSHALISAEATATAGQRKVIRWFIDNRTPIETGNARIRIHRESVRAQIAASQSKVQKQVGRELRRLESKIASLEQELVNLDAQHRSNLAMKDAIVLEAEQALESWNSYFNEMAAIYTRSRSRKSKGGSASAAEIPQFRGLELPEGDTKGPDNEDLG